MLLKFRSVSIFLLCTLSLFALEEKVAPKPAESSKQAYVIESSALRATFEADGTGVREWTMQAKVISDAGVKQLAVLNFPYSSANETIAVVYVRVRKADGSVVTTPEYNVQDMPADVSRSAPLYSDLHEKHVAVKALGVGDTLEYQVRHTITKPEIPNHFWLEYNFNKTLLVKDEQLVVDLPNSKVVKVASGSLTPAIQEKAGRRIYVWKQNHLTQPEAEEDSDDNAETAPTIQISTFSNWEEVGEWYGALQREAIVPTPTLAAKAAELTKGMTSDEDKIRALYNFVSRNVHYVGLDFGIGRFQPHAAQEVLENEYGDCKDKHTLFAALMKAAGYDTWPVLVHSSRKLVRDVPSPAQFNHVISAVPLGGKVLWLDTTPEVAPFQLLLANFRDKEVLVIPTSKAPVVMKTPAELPFPQTQKVTVKGKLFNNDVFTGHYSNVFRGDVEVLLRLGFRNTPETQWKELTQRFVAMTGFAGEVSNVEVSSPSDTTEPFQLSYDYTRKDFGNWSEKQILTALPPTGLEMFGYMDKAPKTKLELGSPGEMDFSLTMEVPQGYSLLPPKAIDLKESFAEFHMQSDFKHNVFTVTRRLVTKQQEVPKEQWATLHRFSKTMGDDQNRFVSLLGGPSAPVANAKPLDIDDKFRAGTEAFQHRDAVRTQEMIEQVIAADPKYPGAHFLLGSALLAQNDKEGAIRNFRKEEEISPEDDRAYQAAAAVETIMGRKEEARDDLRKLLKLEPENRRIALQLSSMLSQDSKEAEAIAVLEDAIKQAPDSDQLQQALGLAYVRSGKVELGLPYLKHAAEQHSGILGIDTLNDIAYELAQANTHLDLAVTYGEQAVKEAELRALDAAREGDASSPAFYSLGAVWDTLGWAHFKNGDTARSEEYVRCAWLLTQSDEIGYHLGRIYEKQGKMKQALHQYELALGAPTTFPAQFPGLTSPNATSRVRQEMLAHYVKLTGKAPVTEVHRLPNGQYTMTAAEELSRMREIKFGAAEGASGSAEFAITIAPTGIESAQYLGGDAGLKDRASRLAKGHYPVEFPTGSNAKIIRRLIFSCHGVEGCNGVLMPSQMMPRVPMLQNP